MNELWSAAFGAVLGASFSVGLWWLDRIRQRKIARISLATDLRHWVNRTLSQMYDMRNYDSSDGNLGTLYSELSEFRFEKSLDRVASIDYPTAMKILRLVRQKDDANDAIAFQADVGDQEDGMNFWRGHAAECGLKALKLYNRLATQLGWSEKIVTDESKKLIQDEVDEFRKREKERKKTNAEFLEGT